VSERDIGPGSIGVIAMFVGRLAIIWGLPSYWHLVTVAGAGLVGISLAGLLPDKTMRGLFRALRLTNKVGGHEQIPTILDYSEDDSRERYRIASPPGVTSDDWRAAELAIMEATGKKARSRYERGAITLELYKADIPQRLPFTVVPDVGFRFPVGQSASGTFHWFRFGNESAHLLIGGMSRMGKSSCIRQGLAQMVLTLPPEQLQIVLIDLKGGVEFQRFASIRHCMGFAQEEPEALDRLAWAEEQMEQRLDLFRRSACLTLDDYNVRHRTWVPRILIVIDEYAELRESKRCQAKIDRLIRRGGVVGVHFIICTQRPAIMDRTISGSVRANIGGTIAFRCRDAANSMILLGHGGAADLALPGRAIYQDTEDQIVQVPWLDGADANELIAGLRSGPPPPQAPTKRSVPKQTPKPPQGVIDIEAYKRSRNP